MRQRWLALNCKLSLVSWEAECMVLLSMCSGETAEVPNCVLSLDDWDDCKALDTQKVKVRAVL